MFFDVGVELLSPSCLFFIYVLLLFFVVVSLPLRFGSVVVALSTLVDGHVTGWHVLSHVNNVEININTIPLFVLLFLFAVIWSSCLTDLICYRASLLEEEVVIDA